MGLADVLAEGPPPTNTVEGVLDELDAHLADKLGEALRDRRWPHSALAAAIREEGYTLSEKAVSAWRKIHAPEWWT